jgi:hypothetical protein
MSRGDAHLSADETNGAGLEEPTLDRSPVDVPEEGLDVLAPFRSRVVPHERVFTS